MITIKWKCPSCDKEGSVLIEARASGDELRLWIKHVSSAVYYQHGIKSLLCESLVDVYLPVHPDAKWVGQEVTEEV